MAHPNSETIKEFLVSINWDGGEDAGEKFGLSLEGALLKANIFADVIIETAKKAVEIITEVVVKFDDLYFESERAKQSVASIESITAAMKFFGVSADTTLKSINAIAAAYRNNAGELRNIERFGFVLDPKTGQFHYDPEVAERNQRGLPDYMVEDLARRLGIDPDLARMIHEHPREIGQKIEEFEDSEKRFQLDPAKAAEEAHKAAESWRKLSNDFGVAAEAVEAKVLPFVTRMIEWFDKTLNRFPDQAKNYEDRFLDWLNSLPKTDYQKYFARAFLGPFGDEDAIILPETMNQIMYYLNQFRQWAEDFFGRLGFGPQGGGGSSPGSSPQGEADRADRDAEATFGARPHGPTEAADASHPRPATDTAMTQAKGYEGLRLYAPEAVAGGPASQGIVDLGRQLQAMDPQTGEFHAFNDAYHHSHNPRSKHTQGLAFDVSMNDRNYEAARQRMRSYLTGLGMIEGRTSGSGDFWIEPGTGDHLHVEFSSQAAADKYESIVQAQRKNRDTSESDVANLPAASKDLTPPPLMTRAPPLSMEASGKPVGGAASSLLPWLFGSPAAAQQPSPWDDWQPGAFGVPSGDETKKLAPMDGGVLGGDSTSFNRFDMPQTTHIAIDGSSDPMTTAALVAQSQERLAEEAARSLQGAVMAT